MELQLNMTVTAVTGLHDLMIFLVHVIRIQAVNYLFDRAAN